MLESEISLSGTDYFLLALDREMRRQGTQGYTCRFALTFDRALDLSQLQSSINRHPVIRWLNNVRKKASWPFCVPRWQSLGNAIPQIKVHDATPDEVWFNRHICDEDHPIRFDYFTATHQLFMSWTHAVMDAHGGETVIKTLGGDLSSDGAWTPKAKSEVRFIEQLNQARSAKRFLSEKSEGHLLAWHGDVKPSKMLTQYRVLTFSPEETAQINANCTAMGANFRKSAFYLSSCAFALFRCISSSDFHKDSHLLVPVPQDQRRRGAWGPVISNQVSFMFYRFDAHLRGDLRGLIESASAQMMDQLRQGSINAYTTLMHLFRRMPLILYGRLIKGPTQGRMASFYFSDTGDSLRGLTHFFGAQVTAATHYPPNSYPPGLTIVFGLFNGQLSATVAYLADLYSDADIDSLTAELRTALIGPAC